MNSLKITDRPWNNLYSFKCEHCGHEFSREGLYCDFDPKEGVLLACCPKCKRMAQQDISSQ